MPVCEKTDGGAVKLTGTSHAKLGMWHFCLLTVSVNTLMNLLWAYPRHKENYSDGHMAVFLLVLILLWLMLRLTGLPLNYTAAK